MHQLRKKERSAPRVRKAAGDLCAGSTFSRGYFADGNDGRVFGAPTVKNFPSYLRTVIFSASFRFSFRGGEKIRLSFFQYADSIARWRTIGNSSSHFDVYFTFSAFPRYSFRSHPVGVCLALLSVYMFIFPRSNEAALCHWKRVQRRTGLKESDEKEREREKCLDAARINASPSSRK